MSFLQFDVDLVLLNFLNQPCVLSGFKWHTYIVSLSQEESGRKLIFGKQVGWEAEILVLLYRILRKVRIHWPTNKITWWPSIVETRYLWHSLLNLPLFSHSHCSRFFISFSSLALVEKLINVFNCLSPEREQPTRAYSASMKTFNIRRRITEDESWKYTFYHCRIVDWIFSQVRSELIIQRRTSDQPTAV